MYTVFAAVLGVSQIGALLVFPLFSKRYSRKTLYTAATILVAGYVLFFFSPMNMLYIGTAGILIFIGQAFIQLLMLVFRRRSSMASGSWAAAESYLALQPFINKVVTAAGVVGTTVIISASTTQPVLRT